MHQVVNSRIPSGGWSADDVLLNRKPLNTPPGDAFDMA
jgi:hypothetical protein